MAHPRAASEAGLRGFQSYAKANDRMTSAYDPAQEPSIIVCNEATKLCGWCMLQPLPFSNYWPAEARLEDLQLDKRINVWTQSTPHRINPGGL